MKVNSTTTLSLPATTAHHCRHDDGQQTWRVDGELFPTLYFTGTIDDLRAFGKHLMETADETVLKEVDHAMKDVAPPVAMEEPLL